MKKSIFAGSFDPITLGHKNIVMRACRDFDEVIVAVAEETGKKTASVADRLKLIKSALKEIDNVQIISFSGSLPSLCNALKIFTLVRGIRNCSDMEYERELLSIYKSQNRLIDCVFYFSEPELSHISSSAIKQILSLNGDISEYVPSSVIEKVAEIYRRSGDNGRAVQSIGGRAE